MLLVLERPIYGQLAVRDAQEELLVHADVVGRRERQRTHDGAELDVLHRLEGLDDVVRRVVTLGRLERRDDRLTLGTTDEGEAVDRHPVLAEHITALFGFSGAGGSVTRR